MPLLSNNTKLVKFRHSSAFIVGKITTCGSHVYDRPEFRQIFQRWIQRTTQSPNNPETQNLGQQQHGPQEEEGFLLFFLVSTSRHCPPLGHWVARPPKVLAKAAGASEHHGNTSQRPFHEFCSRKRPIRPGHSDLTWVILGVEETIPEVLFHEMEIGTRYQKPTDEKCHSFLWNFDKTVFMT